MIPKDTPQYTISGDERKAIEIKAKQRMAAREYFIKEMGNPKNYNINGTGAVVYDPAISRVEANRTFTSQLKFFRPNSRTFSHILFPFLIPAVMLYYAIDRERSTFDGRCRRGEIAYKDRNFKML